MLLPASARPGLALRSGTGGTHAPARAAPRPPAVPGCQPRHLAGGEHGMVRLRRPPGAERGDAARGAAGAGRVLPGVRGAVRPAQPAHHGAVAQPAAADPRPCALGAGAGAGHGVQVPDPGARQAPVQPGGVRNRHAAAGGGRGVGVAGAVGDGGVAGAADHLSGRDGADAGVAAGHRGGVPDVLRRAAGLAGVDAGRPLGDPAAPDAIRWPAAVRVFHGHGPAQHAGQPGRADAVRGRGGRAVLLADVPVAGPARAVLRAGGGVRADAAARPGAAGAAVPLARGAWCIARPRPAHAPLHPLEA